MMVYAETPKEACRGAVLFVRRVLDEIPVHFIMSIEMADEVARSYDPPGKILPQMVYGIPVIIDEEAFGCVLVSGRPLNIESPYRELVIEWDAFWDDDY